jgi:hypothetical protein
MRSRQSLLPIGHGTNSLSKRFLLWIPSWPKRDARPKREKPTMFDSKAMVNATGEFVTTSEFRIGNKPNMIKQIALPPLTDFISK